MTETECKEHFPALYRALKPGGKFLLRTAGPKITPTTTEGKIRNWGEQEGQFILSEKYIKDGFRHETCITIDVVAEEIVEFHEKQRAFSCQEVLNLLEEANFRTIKSYKNLMAEPVDTENFGVYFCIK
jgi:hypothetical protein